MKITTEVGKLTYILRLTEEEARTVRYICGTVTGDWEKSRHKHTNEIYDRLGDLGIIPIPDAEVEVGASHNHIHFSNTKENI
jgi:hypothetical protein